MNDTAWQVLLLVIAALAFFVAAIAGDPSPVSPYRVRIISAGLLFWVVEIILTTAGAL